MNSVPFSEFPDPLPNGVFEFEGDIYDFGGPLEENVEGDYVVKVQYDEPLEALQQSGIFRPDGQRYPNFEFDTEGLVQIFAAYGISEPNMPSIGVVVSDNEVKKSSTEHDGMDIRAFVSKDGLILNTSNGGTFVKHGIIMKEITLRSLPARQRQLRHELGHIISTIIHADAQPLEQMLYQQEELLAKVRTAGLIIGPLGMISDFISIAHHNTAQMVGSTLLAGLGFYAYVDTRGLLWRFDKEERFASKVARQQRQVPILKATGPKGAD